MTLMYFESTPSRKTGRLLYIQGSAIMGAEELMCFGFRIWRSSSWMRISYWRQPS